MARVGEREARRGSVSEGLGGLRAEYRHGWKGQRAQGRGRSVWKVGISASFLSSFDCSCSVLKQGLASLLAPRVPALPVCCWLSLCMLAPAIVLAKKVEIYPRSQASAWLKRGDFTAIAFQRCLLAHDMHLCRRDSFIS